MIYLKSVFAGLGTLLLSMVLVMFLYLIDLAIRFHVYPWELSATFESEGHIHGGLRWVTLAAFLIFLCGFVWQFRRASKRM
jgi:hypothetical protein